MSMMLPPGEVHVWLASVQVLQDAAVQAAAVACLLPDERVSWQRFVHAYSRDEYLLTRLMCRQVLSHVTGVAPAAWEFVRNRYGRPEIAAPSEHTALQFNLSNTRDFVACGVAWRADLGVDIERPSRATDFISLSRAVLSPAERELLLKQPASDQARHFYSLWTVKEAYIKARGQGVSMGVENITVNLTPPPIALVLPAQWQDAPQDWQIACCDPAPDVVLGVAVRRGVGGDWPVHVHYGVPL